MTCHDNSRESAASSLPVLLTHFCFMQAGEIARSSGRMALAAFERTKEVNERYHLTERASAGSSSCPHAFFNSADHIRLIGTLRNNQADYVAI